MVAGSSFKRKSCFLNCAETYKLNTNEKTKHAYQRRYGMMYLAMWQQHLALERRKQTKCLEGCHKMMMNLREPRYHINPEAWDLHDAGMHHKIQGLHDPNKPMQKLKTATRDLTNLLPTAADRIALCQKKCVPEGPWAEGPADGTNTRDLIRAKIKRCKIECAGGKVSGFGGTLDPRTPVKDLLHPMLKEHTPQAATDWSTIKIGVGAVVIGGALFYLTS